MEDERKIISGTALLYTVITCFFGVFNRLGIFLTASGSFLKKLGVFLYRNSLWVIAVAIIITLLVLYSRKIGHSFKSYLMDSRIRKLAGVLILIQGVTGLAGSLPIYIMSIKGLYLVSRQAMDMSYNLKINLAVDIISVAAILCQIVLGIFMITYNKATEVD